MKNINDMSEEEQIEFIKKNPFSFELIKAPSIAVQLAAVKQNGHAIEYIKSLSIAVQLAAVKQDGFVIRYIKNPTKTVIITAILKSIQKGNYDYAIALINKYDHKKWTELDIIKTSL